jgi:hypothetical protein
LSHSSLLYISIFKSRSGISIINAFLCINHSLCTNVSYH